MAAIVIEKNLMVPMHDGVRLAADIIRLDEAGPQPVLMARTPYNKDLWLVDNLAVFDMFRAAQAGYTVIVQDTRGRFASEGEFTPMFQERADGVDAIQWAAAQPWSNGVVGLFGGSYVGMTQWLPAQEQPKALRAIAPMVTFSDLYEGMQYQGGVKLLHGLEWSLAMSFETARRRAANGERPLPDLTGLDRDAMAAHLPLVDQPLLRDLAPYYNDWLAHPLPGAFWQAGSPNSAYEQITVPALNIGGWYDVFLWGTLQNYIGMRQRGGSEAARQHQRLIIGPWSHMNNFGSYPEREFGMAASLRALDLTGAHLRWFDCWLKGVENGINQEQPVTLFVMGIDQWRTEDDWPLPDTQYRHYYLHSGGQANTLHGDGLLSPEIPGDEPPDTYLYNPLRPVPTVGGQVLIPGANGTGPRDQRQVEEREDVLVYSTPVLDRPIEVTGPIQLELFITSSALDTDFTGKLVDVYPDGRALILTEGILRARYHQSMTEPALLEPGTIYKLRLDLWATANVFLPGHRIRLEVSSSNFPRFARNTNTGGDCATEGADQCVAAVNRIFHDSAHPSHLILPIIER
ncbi:MAG: CocE/NonD family hydrolase [Chloroflexi bacterium]|nr:CocE/NonD family hydrolase [Chloroflexota bacterium]MDL1883611.1 CocE/NonD family hydrolase [Anaerolineae bacterium CFX8]